MLDRDFSPIESVSSPMKWRQRIGRVLPVLIVGAIASLSSGGSAAQGPARGCKNCPPAQRVEFATAEAAFVAARNASLANDPDRFERAAAAARLSADHPLAHYVEYWRLRMRLAQGTTDDPVLDAEAADFARRHAHTLLGDLLRRDWMLSLGRRQDWERFDRAYSGWVLRDEAPLHCLALQSRASRGEDVAAAARALLLVPRDLGDACNNLLASLALGGQLSPDDLWRRLEVSLEAGSPSATRRAALLVNPALDTAQLDRASSRPAVALAAGALPRETALVAFSSLARTEPAAAAERLRDPALRLPAADRAFLWSQVAAGGMRRLAPESLEWAKQASAARPTDQTLAWMARAALRAQDWQAVRATIERMSEAGQADPTWIYWLGRAFKADARPESQHQARVLFTSISHRPDFYSQLAGEELGLLTAVPRRAPSPTEAELAEVRSLPGFVRALALYDLGLRFEGNREWNFQLRGMTDRQLLATAEHARQRGLLDRAIASAERTRDEHDYSLRFVMPHATRLNASAKTSGVDPAWVYGLIRQESRFVSDARSSAGASGLMQLMPATARWVAGKMGMRGFRPAQVNDLDTNLQLGTFYLRMVLDDLDGSPLLASAAYNAGPGRPKAWRSTLAGPVEGAIFAETIPFAETRGYVKAVLSNATYYAAMLSGKPQSLRTLLGTVHPAPAGGADGAAALPETD
jgi:soluble lytic murein transglycosylase